MKAFSSSVVLFLVICGEWEKLNEALESIGVSPLSKNAVLLNII